MENNKVTVWHFIVPSLMVTCGSLIVVCFINQTTNERLLLTNEILARRNHLLDSLFKVSDREDDSLRNRCDSLERGRILTFQQVISCGHKIDTTTIPRLNIVNTIPDDTATFRWVKPEKNYRHSKNVNNAIFKPHKP
jgi:hypothetical protein